MRVCLMIEGQENVTWDQWVSLALACEASDSNAPSTAACGDRSNSVATLINWSATSLSYTHCASL